MEVKLEFEDLDKYGERQSVTVSVDGHEIAWGSYGGEPEDNSRGRDYAWVEDALTRLACALGADNRVTCVNKPYNPEND